MAAQQSFTLNKLAILKKNVLKKELLKKSNCSEEMAAPKKQLLCESSYFKEVCSFYKKQSRPEKVAT